MQVVFGACLLAIASVLPVLARAHWPDQPQHQMAHLGELKLEGGGVIANLKMSFVTHGKLNDLSAPRARDFRDLHDSGIAPSHS